MTRPVRQWMLPARYRFSLFPGVSTAACSPRFIHMHPTFGFRFTSTSSMNTAVSSAGRPLSNARRAGSFFSRSGSFGRMVGPGPPPHQAGRPAARGGPSPARPAPGSPPAARRPPPRNVHRLRANRKSVGRERQHPPDHQRRPDVDAGPLPTPGPAEDGVHPVLSRTAASTG